MNTALIPQPGRTAPARLAAPPTRQSPWHSAPRLPDDPNQERALASALRRELKAAGCFDPAPLAIALRMSLVAAAFATGFVLLLHGPALPWRLLTLAGLAFVTVQAMYIGHDAFHGVIARRRWVGRLAGQVFFTLLTGVPAGHYRYIHSRHHPHCQEPGKDEDMETGVFKLYPGARGPERTRFGRFVSRHQAVLLWPLVTLQGFSVKWESAGTLRRDPRGTRLDQAVLVLHALLWLALPAVVLGVPAALLNYLLVTWFAGPYTASVLLINHIGTHVWAPGSTPSNFRRQLLTTRSIGHSRLADFLCGGLNHHVEHHLFPSIPTARLPRARQITQAFCQAHHLPYRHMSWLQAMGEVFHYVRAVARDAAPAPAAQEVRP